MKCNFILTAFLFLAIGLRAQVDSSELNKYFDDGVKSVKSINWVAKLGLTEAIAGDLSLSLERSLGKVFTLEAGVGVLLPYHLPDYYEFMSFIQNNGDYFYDDYFKTIKGGWSWRFNPRIYTRANNSKMSGKQNFFSLGGPAPHGIYFSLLLRQRNYKIDYTGFNDRYTSMQTTDINIVWGMQRYLDKNLAIDLYLGAGVMLFKTKKDNGEKSDVNPRFNAPLGVKLGYRF